MQMSKRISAVLLATMFGACLHAHTCSAAVIDLGDAADFLFLAMTDGTDGGSITISSSSSATGKLGIGPSGSYDKSGTGDVIGNVLLAPGVTTAISGTGSPGTLIPNSDLTQAIADALQASQDISLLASTQVFIDITNSQTIIGNGGLNVISLNSIGLGGSDALTLSGGAADFFIFNVAAGFDMGGSSDILLSGGALASHVLFNFSTAGSDLGISASGIGLGTILAPHRDFVLHGALVNGAILANDIRVTSGGVANQVSFETPQDGEEEPPTTPVIPEPSTLSLMGLGLAAASGLIRRTFRQS